MLKRCTGGDFDQVYRIMEQSFPLDEYRPYAQQKKLMQEPEYTIYVRREPETARIQGFLSVWEFPACGYIEHFAVDPGCRGGGLGAAMLQQLQARLPGLLCLEVELPDCALARRRIGFYRRNGFFLNDYPYIQPPIAAGRKAIPLRLMTTGGRIPEDTYLQLRSLLYRRVYQVAPEELARYEANESE